MLHKNKFNIRRAKPLLGTFVEISLASQEHREEELLNLSSDCFREIQRIHCIFSYFDVNSEISKINMSIPDKEVKVSDEVIRILKIAVNLYEETNGKFDIMHRGRAKFPQAALKFSDNSTVTRTHSAEIDLGGIAKGYAVDMAAEMIAKFPAVKGVVNAGGDIKFVGRGLFPLGVRSALENGRYFDLGNCPEGAVATSVFKERPHQAVTVFADKCIYADALTKIAAFSTDCADILSKYGARVQINNDRPLIQLWDQPYGI